MLSLSGLFAATNTTIREGRAAFPDFVFGGLADGGLSFNSEEGYKLGICRAEKRGRQTILANHAAECFSLPVTGVGTTPLYRKTPRPWWLGYSRFR